MYHHYKESTYPDTYRQQEMKCLLDTICLERSARVVGLSGMGKSNLLRFLVSHPHLLENHPRFPAKSVCFLHVDCNRLNPVEPYRFYQVCNRLMQTQHPPTDDVQRLYDYLSESLSALPRDALVVVVIDRIEQLYEGGGESFFNQLRNLRDNARSGRMIFIVGSQRPIGDLFELEKLFSHICWVGPFTLSDRAFFFARHQTRLNISIDEGWREVLWEITGGHPGLLKNGLEWWLHHHQQFESNQTDEITKSLLVYKPIERYCVRLQKRLTQVELDMLLELITTSQVLKDKGKDVLQKTGLVLDKQGKLTLFSVLWQAHLESSLKKDNTFKITVDPKTQRVTIWRGWQVKETIIGRLKVFTLLEILTQNPGEICQREDLFKAIYSEDVYFNSTDDRLNQLISPLRKIIDPLVWALDFPRGKSCIQSVRGVGYKLNFEGE